MRVPAFFANPRPVITVSPSKVYQSGGTGHVDEKKE
jgi:hypothetical protein